MAENKKSFLLYADWIHTVKKLPKAKAGELFMIILSYVNDENPVVKDHLVDLVFEPIKRQLKRDLKKYEDVKETKSTSGSMGNLKRWNNDLYSSVLSGTMKLDEAVKIAEHRRTSHSDKNDRTVSHRVANVAVTVNDTVNVTVNDTNKKENLIETFFNDLENSSQFEQIAKNLFLKKDQLKNFLPGFRQKAELSYPSFDRFATHFKNWVSIQLRSQKSSTTTKPKNQF